MASASVCEKEAIHGHIFKQDEELMWKNSKDNYSDLTRFFQKVSEFIFELWRLAMTCHDLQKFSAVLSQCTTTELQIDGPQTIRQQFNFTLSTVLFHSTDSAQKNI